MKKKFFGTEIVAIIVFISVLGLIGMALEGSKPKCIKSGCDNEQASGSSYCYIHKPSSYSGGSTGSTSGYQSRNSNSGSYVASGTTSGSESDTCHHGSCKKEVIRGSRYCASHTCGKGRNGCYREVIGANELCSSCREKKKNQSSNSSNSYNNSSGSSKSSKTYKRDTYDDGYEAVYDDDYYDMDRYYKDDDYARGVDDAMDDLEDEGEEW